MQLFLIIFYNQILISFRKPSKILANLIFFAIFVSFFAMVLSPDKSELNPNLMVTIILFSLLFSILIFSGDFLHQDYQDGTLEQIINACSNIEIFILAKMLCNWLESCIAIILIAILFFYLNGFTNNFYPKLLLLLFITLNVNFICTFCASLVMINSSNLIISIIALPLILPILLIGHLAILEQEKLLPSIIALTIFSGGVSVIATAKIVKIALE